jgi:DNA-damage-inducible protein D
MSGEIAAAPEYRATMDRLEKAKRVSAEGVHYWFAREVYPILGYLGWREFEGVIDRARDSFRTNGIDPSHHFVLTHKMMGVGKGGQRQGDDFFLSRAACYLVAMNGDPKKPEIAAAQAYFAVQTRRMEVEDELSEDEKRLHLRNKVRQSHKRVSKAAQDAGVRSQMQGVFHDARVQGLYGMSLKEMKIARSLNPSEQIFDRAGPLELSANDFQMNLAAEVIHKENVRGEQLAIRRNKEVALHVRDTIKLSGGTMPEKLPLEPPIKEVERRLRGKGKTLKSNDLSNG